MNPLALSNHPLLSPEKFLGRQVYSYGQLLTITFTSETAELLPNNVTLLLQGSGATLTADLSPQPLFSHDPDLTPRRSFEIRYSENRTWICMSENITNEAAASTW